jgi:hypothetical protein
MGPCLHHYHLLPCSDQQEVKFARHAMQFALGRVHHKLAVEASDPHRTAGPLPRQVRAGQGGGGCVDGEDGDIRLLIYSERDASVSNADRCEGARGVTVGVERDRDLGVVEPIAREEGPHAAVDRS